MDLKTWIISISFLVWIVPAILGIAMLELQRVQDELEAVHIAAVRLSSEPDLVTIYRILQVASLIPLVNFAAVSYIRRVVRLPKVSSIQQDLLFKELMAIGYNIDVKLSVKGKDFNPDMTPEQREELEKLLKEIYGEENDK